MPEEKFKPTPGVLETADVPRIKKEIKPEEELPEDLLTEEPLFIREAKKTERFARSKTLKNYLQKDFPYIKGSRHRTPDNDALVVYASHRLFLKKEKERSENDEELVKRFQDDLGSVENQYYRLIDLLPSNTQNFLPPFADRDWTDNERENFVNSQIFEDETDANYFITRASNLSQIAKQIKLAQGLLRVEQALGKQEKPKTVRIGA